MASVDEPERPLSDAPPEMTGDVDAPHSAETVAAAAPPESRSRSDWLVAAGALVLATVIALGAYLSFAVPARWFSTTTARTWSAAELKLIDGTGVMDGSALLITAPDATNNIVLALTTDFASGEYPAIAWSVHGLPDDADTRMLWRSNVDSRRTNLVPVPTGAGQTLPLVMTRESKWNGRVVGLGLAIRLPAGTQLATPLRIDGVTAKPMTAIDVLGDRVREWLAFEGINGTSINTITGGADSQSLPLPPLAAAVGLLACLLLVLLHRFAPGLYRPANAATVASIVFAIWFIVDARWAWNLVQQTRDTVAKYSGKTVEDKHLAAEDRDLYAFVAKARALMPAQPSRVFVAASEHYFRGRAAYHLYPNNVEFAPFSDRVAPPSAMRAGDWIFVYHRRGMQYDAAAKMLRWDGGAPVHAELKLVEPNGAALFQVR